MFCLRGPPSRKAAIVTSSPASLLELGQFCGGFPCLQRHGAWLGHLWAAMMAWSSLESMRRAFSFTKGSRGFLGLHLVHDLLAMECDRDFAGAGFGGDLLVEPPGHDQAHHFALARRELFIPRTQLCPSRPLRGFGQAPERWRPADPGRGRAWSNTPPPQLSWPAPTSGGHRGRSCERPPSGRARREASTFSSSSIANATMSTTSESKRTASSE